MEFAGKTVAQQMEMWIQEEYAHIGWRRELGISKLEEERWIRQKLQLFEFDGSRCDDWISEMEDIFDFFQLSEEVRLKAAILSLESEARWWFEWEHQRRPFGEWQELKDAVARRFGLPLYCSTGCVPSWWETAPLNSGETSSDLNRSETSGVFGGLHDSGADYCSVDGGGRARPGEFLEGCDAVFNLLDDSSRRTFERGGESGSGYCGGPGIKVDGEEEVKGLEGAFDGSGRCAFSGEEEGRITGDLGSWMWTFIGGFQNTHEKGVEREELQAYWRSLEEKQTRYNKGKMVKRFEDEFGDNSKAYGQQGPLDLNQKGSPESISKGNYVNILNVERESDEGALLNIQHLAIEMDDKHPTCLTKSSLSAFNTILNDSGPITKPCQGQPNSILPISSHLHSKHQPSPTLPFSNPTYSTHFYHWSEHKMQSDERLKPSNDKPNYHFSTLNLTSPLFLTPINPTPLSSPHTCLPTTQLITSIFQPNIPTHSYSSTSNFTHAIPNDQTQSLQPTTFTTLSTIQATFPSNQSTPLLQPNYICEFVVLPNTIKTSKLHSMAAAPTFQYPSTIVVLQVAARRMTNEELERRWKPGINSQSKHSHCFKAKKSFANYNPP